MNQSTFLTSIQRCIEQHRLIETRQHIYVAVSGGADSVALLTALYLLGYDVSLLHCNFHLRGAESDTDEEFVRNLSNRLDIPCSVKHYDTLGYAKEHGLSVEMAARELRYSWFNEIYECNPDSRIAIAHNADDVLETFLLNLSKGTSIRGLSGMPYIRDKGIIRPLMDLSRKDIETFIATNELFNSFRTDSTNYDIVYQRNYIRHQLLPRFEVLNPSYKTSIRTTIEQLRGVQAFYEESINRYKSLVLVDSTIKIKELMACPSPSTLLFELLYPYGFTSQQCRDIMSSLPNLPSGGKFYAQEYRLVKSWGILEILPKKPYSFDRITFKLGSVPATIKLDDYRTLLISKVSQIEYASHTLYLSCSDLGEELTVRLPYEGERMQLFGMKYGHKKISRILIDQKASQKQREEALLLLRGDTPLWLLSFAKSEQTRLNTDAGEYIRIILQETNK